MLPQNRQSYLISKEKIVLDQRYRPLKKVGQGAYGMVISAKDGDNANKRVAIKKNKDVFYNLTNSKRILREMKLLRHMNHANIVKMTDIIPPLTKDSFQDVYLVLEYMQSDLHRIIRSSNALSHDHIGFIVYQTLCGIKHMHSCGIIHRDLKPGNILINESCESRICDFGLARGLPEAGQDHDDPELMTEYVVTRWYRAPEIVVCARQYDKPVDLWSLGCILAELYHRKPIFKGKDYADQLRVIFDIIGTPSQEDLYSVLTEDGLEMLDRFKPTQGQEWSKVLPKASSDAIDLISKLLVFDPSKRISVDDALQHPFLAKFYDDDFVSKSSSSRRMDMRYEKGIRSRKTVRSLMLDEVRHFRPFDPLFCTSEADTLTHERKRANSNSGRFSFITNRWSR